MGLFSRNFNKPGPGVRKDEPRKKGAARFFELLFRDLGDLVKLNMMFCICVLPSLVMFGMGLMYDSVIALAVSLLLAFPIGGAIVAAVYYITKMMRDDPSYVWFEFKRKFLENFKQAAPIGMICTAFVYAQIMLWVSFVLGAQEGAGGDIVWFFIALLSLLVFGIITPYIFLHLAYVELKSLKTLKNSVLMSFGYLPRSFMGAVAGGLLWIVFALFLPVSLIFVPVILILAVSFSMLMGLMWIWPPFNNHFKIEETLLARLEEEAEKDQETAKQEMTKQGIEK